MAKFDEYYNVSDSELKAKQKDVSKRILSRKFDSAIDDCENKIMEAEEKRETLYKNVNNPKSFNPNDLIAVSLEISNLQQAKETLLAEKKAILGA